jgi:hypothetical protein
MKKKPKFAGYRITGNRITSSRQARQMLGRLAGLKSARKQRALGWPNLQKAIAMRRLRCKSRRCADQTVLSVVERDEAWLRLKALGVERASALDRLEWMMRFQRRKAPDRLNLHALACALIRERSNCRPRLDQNKPSSGLRGMTLMQARRAGLM